MTKPITRLWGIDLTRAHQSDSQRTCQRCVRCQREPEKRAQATAQAGGGKMLEVAPPDTGVCSRIFTQAKIYFQMVISSFPIK
jgi:hypothetical protein